MIGSFGDIVFEASADRVRTFDEMKRASEARYAEHAVIGGKPKLEFLGPGLETISFQVLLSSSLGVDPDKELDALSEIRDAGEIRRLVIGSKPLGKFVLTSISANEGPRSNRGRPTWISVELSLKEYIEDE